MQLEKVFDLNENYLMVPCHSPDTDTVTVRAIETETIQTTASKFYILNKDDNSVVSIFGLTTEAVDTLKTDINNVIIEEVNKANSYLNAFGIVLNVVVEVLTPHEVSAIVEVPTLSSYQDSFERETVDYLNNCGGLITESIERKSFINAAFIKLKSSFVWNAMDVITVLTQSTNFDPRKINTNLKVGTPAAWRGSYLGVDGVADNDGVNLDGNVNGAYIALGYQPLADDFYSYYPTPNFTRDNASVTVKIFAATGNGTIFCRSNNQDLLSYNEMDEKLFVNLTGGNLFENVVEVPYVGDIDGIWTLNRIDNASVEIWKDGVLITTVSIPSADFNLTGCYSALGYGGEFSNAVDGIYQFAFIGRALIESEIIELNTFMDNYLTGMTTNDLGSFA